MKRKFLAVVSSASLLLCSCVTENDSSSEKSLYEHGLDVISLMDEMVKSESYGEAMSAPSEILEVSESIADGNYDAPSAVYKLEVNSFETLYEIGEKDIPELSNTLRDNLEHRYYSSIAAQMNGTYGASSVAAASIYTAGKNFVSKELSEDTIYIYTFADSYPVMVTFTPGEGGAASASGSFILDDEFKSDGEQDIDMLLESTYYILGGKAEKLEIG